MPPQQPWWTYMMIALWSVMIVAAALGAVALWRIGTALRRIAFHIERSALTRPIDALPLR
jgi:hypothetical protein